ncbi:MAG: sugar phosphate isomerase [Kiritimatiellae bacterium]|nr:sugar phosphate isomerase [Kiritimatiellia bacterium]
MNNKAHRDAEYFLDQEKQFHLGVLPTEQSNPKTRNIDRVFKTGMDKGLKTLLSVDYDVAKMAGEVLTSHAFRKLVEAGGRCLNRNGNIIFSGCGATGRLSILLESIWRRFFADTRRRHSALYAQIQSYENRVFSIMTGGDYALIKSVESFEDYAEFGRQQVREQGVTGNDILIAITEGGETSSVLGSVAEAAERGAEVFLLFNNPADILCAHIERSRKAIIDPRVTVLDLYCGPMAIAGSTRMQATTFEQLAAGAALENILYRILKDKLSGAELERLNIKEHDYAAEFTQLLDQLNAPGNIAELGKMIRLEAKIYRQEGLVTYFAENYLLDILTDTTERAPTFMLPPFRKYDDLKSPPSWAFVKNPRFSTPGTWEHTLARHPRCVEWNRAKYKIMGAPEKTIASPPALGYPELLKFLIGNEPDPSRTSRQVNAALMAVSGTEAAGHDFTAFSECFNRAAANFRHKLSLVVGDTPCEAKHAMAKKGESDFKPDFRISVSICGSALRLIEHLAVKLTLNTLSTATMIVMGRVTGNWMSWVEVSNKKLRDRGIRLISELCGISYRDACYALHETLVELEQINFSDKGRPSPIQYTIRKLKPK